MLNKYKLILLRENNTINDKAIKWFHSKWKVPEIEYKKVLKNVKRKKREFHSGI